MVAGIDPFDGYAVGQARGIKGSLINIAIEDAQDEGGRLGDAGKQLHGVGGLHGVFE